MHFPLSHLSPLSSSSIYPLFFADIELDLDTINLHPDPDDCAFLAQWSQDDPMDKSFPEHLLEASLSSNPAPPLDPPPLIVVVALRSDDCPLSQVTDQLPSMNLQYDHLDMASLAQPQNFTNFIQLVHDSTMKLVPCCQLKAAGIPFTIGIPRVAAPKQPSLKPADFATLAPSFNEGAPTWTLHQSPIRHYFLVVSFVLRIHWSMDQVFLDLSPLPPPLDPALDPPLAKFNAWIQMLRFLANQPSSFWTMSKYVDLAQQIAQHYKDAETKQTSVQPKVTGRKRNQHKRNPSIVILPSSRPVFQRLGSPKLKTTHL